MKILVTGGAGYIGSHVAKQLLETTGHELIVVDNLSTGSMKTLRTLEQIGRFEFIRMDLSDFSAVDALFCGGRFDAVMHFAASIVVPESVENPMKYYMNNTVNTANLIACADRHRVKKFIFSSTAAVYGEPVLLPVGGIDEDFETKPINPYGQSKLMSERILIDAAKASSLLKYVIFRYFNVAGADIFYKDESLAPRIGQSFPGATHLIKIASECAAGKRKEMSIFGNDYATSDGSGVRDYIHVEDLAEAHVKAVEYLENGPSGIFNAGYGKGYSVKEVIAAMESASHKSICVKIAPRRVGDPAALVCNSTKLKTQMQWQPKHEDLGLICQSAFAWEIGND